MLTITIHTQIVFEIVMADNNHNNHYTVVSCSHLGQLNFLRSFFVNLFSNISILYGNKKEIHRQFKICCSFCKRLVMFVALSNRFKILFNSGQNSVDLLTSWPWRYQL